MHYLIKDTEFNEILKFLKKIKRIHKKDVMQLRNFLEAVTYMLKAGCQWRLLPRCCYGDWRAVHKRFKEWSNRGIWKVLFEATQRDPDMEQTMIDATIVRAHACAAGYVKYTQPNEALGRSKGGFSTKIHALVDALGNPLKFILTPGQRNDITQANSLTKDLFDTSLIADKGYDSDDFINSLECRSCTAVIPPKSNRKKPREYDKYVYKERNLIERFFGKIKHFRRVFSRFDKSARTYLSCLYFVGMLIWLR